MEMQAPLRYTRVRSSATAVSEFEKVRRGKNMKTKWLAILTVTVPLTACAGGRQLATHQAEAPEIWGAKYKTSLIAHSIAKTPVELAAAIDGLVLAAETAPTDEAQLMATRDACLAAAAAADGAVLTKLNCEAGALKNLIGGY